MYERSFGYRYAELGDHPSAAEIAKAIRADVKQAKGEGLLPASWSYSVRSDTFSGGCSIDVEVRDCADAYRPCDGMNCRNVWCRAKGLEEYRRGWEDHSVLTDNAQAAKMTLERIHNAYNHDGSEIMVDYFDVRYYGIVSFESADSADFRKREAERLAAKKAARESGAIAGRVKNYKRDGSSVTHLLIETADGKKLGCGARIWRNSLLGKAAADAELTCSRCAKRYAQDAAATREP